MKLQFDAGRIRMRLTEADLAHLLGGHDLRLALRLHGRPLFDARVELGDALAFEAGREWHIVLPRAAVEAHAATLPNREGLEFALDAAEPPLRLRVDVDVRDSLSVRGPLRFP